MYIRVTRNTKGQTYYHLVEAYRKDGKVKQRTLLSLGRAEDGKLEKLAEAISKHLDIKDLFNRAKDIDIKDAYILGPLLVLDRMMEELGIYKILEQVQANHKKLQFDLIKVIFAQICSRFVRPVSKLALYDNWMERLYPLMVDHSIELQHIYRSLDLLAMHKEDIEQYLYRYKKDLFNLATDVVLYDLTTLRFESIREDSGKLRRFGYSKEMRNDCTQVVLGLLTDTDGIPLCFEVHPGNTFEGKTLNGIIDKIKNKFTIRRFIFIADRGLFSFDNLQHIKEQKGEFIVGLRMGAMKQHLQKDYYNLHHFLWINEELAVYETTLGEERCIITWSKARAKRDRSAREDVLEKIRSKLASKQNNIQKFITNPNYKKYLRINNESGCELNQSAIDEQATRDGFFGIITNVKDMSATAIVLNYKQLWKIEDAFGEIKGTLKTRPIFHWTDTRIIGHLTMCFLAYLCEAHLTKALRKSEDQLESKAIKNKIIESRPLTVVQAMNELNEIMAIPVNIKQHTIWVRTDVGSNAQKLLTTIGMRIPPKILSEYPKM
jgi:transposase